MQWFLRFSSEFDVIKITNSKKKKTDKVPYGFWHSENLKDYEIYFFLIFVNKTYCVFIKMEYSLWRSSRINVMYIIVKYQFNVQIKILFDNEINMEMFIVSNARAYGYELNFPIFSTDFQPTTISHVPRLSVAINYLVCCYKI